MPDLPASLTVLSNPDVDGKIPQTPVSVHVIVRQYQHRVDVLDSDNLVRSE